MKRLHLILALIFAFTTALHADDWMKNLPDNVYISQLSIPGTHDSATGNGVSLATFTQCQDIPVSEQWAAGIRAFDLRPQVKDGYLNINHGIAATKLRFDEALYMLRDSLATHPSEFVIVHYHYDTDYDEDKSAYLPLLKAILERDDMKDCLIPFHRNLTLGDVRGKMLLLSRQAYADRPYAGGFINYWTSGLDWESQKDGWITGMSNAYNNTAPLYMQDYYNTDDSDAGLQKKVDAVVQLLEWTSTHATTGTASVVWAMNFTSAYSGKLCTANGYRKTASRANAAVIDYYKTHAAGPSGIVFMDFCVDTSNGYATRGQELINTLIDNNYNCFGDAAGIVATNGSSQERCLTGIYSLQGRQLSMPQQGEVNIMKYSDGTVKKAFVRAR